MSPISSPIKSLTVCQKMIPAVYEVSHYKLHPFLVQKAWDSACQFWSIYNYSQPRVNRSSAEEKNTLHRPNIAHINFAEQRVTANLHRLEEVNCLDLLEPVFKHELGHKFCPETLKNLLLINYAVKQIVEIDETAKIIENLFTDMIDNTLAHGKGDRGIHTLYCRVWEKEPDVIQQIIGRAYEKVFQRADTSRSYQQTIIRVKPEAEIESAAEKVAGIILNSEKGTWLKNAKEFAEVLLPFGNCISVGKIYVISELIPEDFSPEGASPIPPKGKSNLKELEKRLGRSVYDLRQIEGGSDNKPCAVATFMKFLGNSKIKVEEEEALIWYYRDIISGKVVKVPEVSASEGAYYPLTPLTWVPSHGFGKLDHYTTMVTSGKFTPGYRSVEWKMKRGHHLKVGRDYPDLDLWIDSSGSMDNPAEKVSHAVACGMIVSKSFLATRKSVRVVNWSGENQVESTPGFIRNEDEIDRKLVKYFGNGTALPIAEIEKPYLEKGKQKYIVMITDLQIQNLTEDTINRLKRVYKRSVDGTVFLIGEKTEAEQKIFTDIGFKVVPVKNIADLDRYALKLTKKLFEERLETR